MCKKSIKVSAIFAEEYTFPVSVCWENDCNFDVEQIIESDGISQFTCVVNGLPHMLVYEKEQWYEKR